MSRKFCVTVYRALASPTRLQLWSGTVASCVRSSTRGRSGSFCKVAATESDASAWRSNSNCASPVAARQEPNKRRRICCCHAFARSWKKCTVIRKGTARVAQHQSPPSKISTPMTQASPEKPSKQRRQLGFRLCPRRRVKLRSTTHEQRHPWRRSSTILDMVPLSFLRNRIL